MTQKTPRRRFGFHLVGLARRWRNHLDRRLAAAGLSDASWAPLIHLHEVGDGMHQKDLAAAVGLDGSSLVRLLDILEKQELIERQIDQEDRRARRIKLTMTGHDAVADIRKQLVRIEDGLLEDLSDDEIKVVLKAFERIEHRLRDRDGASSS